MFSFSLLVTLNTFSSSGSWFKVFTLYVFPFRTNLSSSSRLCFLKLLSLFAAHSTGNNVFHFPSTSIGYSLSTYIPRGRSNLFSRMNSASCLWVSSTDMGRGLFLLYLPSLQPRWKVRCFAAFAFSSSVSPCIMVASTLCSLSKIRLSVFFGFFRQSSDN